MLLGHRGHGGEQLGMRFLKPSHHSSWRLQVQLSLSESIMAHPATATAEHLRRKRRSSCSQALALRAHPPFQGPQHRGGQSQDTWPEQRRECCAVSKARKHSACPAGAPSRNTGAPGSHSLAREAQRTSLQLNNRGQFQERAELPRAVETRQGWVKQSTPWARETSCDPT